MFQQKLIKDLKKKGFKPNPYGPCLVNQEVNGSQLTITLHVDDLRESYKDPKEVAKIIDHLSSLYEKLPNKEITKMDVQRMDERKKVHNHLGMDCDY